MSKYIKLFETHTEYQTYINGSDKVLPNVSYCEDNNGVHYNPWTWAEAYFTTVALEDGTISFNIWKSMGTEYITSISYSTDNGETWTTTANQNNKSENLVIDVDVNTGDKVLWKGTATQTGYYEENGYGEYVGSFFSSDCEFDAKGNVMSLLYGDNYKGQTTIEENGAFCCLFYDYDDEKTCSIVNAKDLSLPATTLTQYCYSDMFSHCTLLVTAPSILPATTLTNSCYASMFYRCTSLVTAPRILPATTLTNYCYSYMFYRCTSLVTAPSLPATTLGDNCYNQMFDSCTALVNAPVLPATTLTNYCYSSMFNGCTSLVNAPTLPATTLADFCYSSMFRGCTSLVNSPSLPATTLAYGCYSHMFSNTNLLPDITNIDFTSESVVGVGGLYGLFGGTNITDNDLYQILPKNNENKYYLPVTTLTDRCYAGMFEDCTSLVTAPALPATTLAQNCYQNMFRGCTALVNAPELPATTLTNYCYNGMFQDCTSLVNAPELPATTLVNSCYAQMFRGCSSLNYIKAMFTTTPSGEVTKYYTVNWVQNVSATGTFVKNSAAQWNVSGVHGIPTGWTVQTASE